MPKHSSANRETSPFPTKQRAAKDRIAKDAAQPGSAAARNGDNTKQGFAVDIAKTERSGRHGASEEPSHRQRMAEDANADLPANMRNRE